MKTKIHYYINGFKFAIRGSLKDGKTYKQRSLIIYLKRVFEVATVHHSMNERIINVNQI